MFLLEKSKVITQKQDKNPVKLKPKNETWVEVLTKCEVTILLDPYTPSHTHVMCITGTGVADGKAGKLFWKLVSNFSDKEVNLLQH